MSGGRRRSAGRRAVTLVVALASACATAETPRPVEPVPAPATVAAVAEPETASPLDQILGRRSLWFGSGVVLVHEDLDLVQAWRLRTLASLEGVGRVAIWRPPAGERDLVAAGLDPATATAALAGRTAETRPVLAAFDSACRLSARFEIDWPPTEQPGLLAVCASRDGAPDLVIEPEPDSVLARTVNWVRRTSRPGADDHLAVGALAEYRANLLHCPTSLDALARLAAEPGVTRIALATNGRWDSARMTGLGVPPWVSLDVLATHGWSAEHVPELAWIWGPRWRRLVILPAARSDAWPADVPSLLVRVD